MSADLLLVVVLCAGFAVATCASGLGPFDSAHPSTSSSRDSPTTQSVKNSLTGHPDVLTDGRPLVLVKEAPSEREPFVFLWDGGRFIAKRPGAFGFLTLPDDYPEVQIVKKPSASPRLAEGYIFTDHMRSGNITTHQYLLILDNTGGPVWYHRFPWTTGGTTGPRFQLRDFKLQGNNQLSYIEMIPEDRGWHVLNNSFKRVRTIVPANGYDPDHHDMKIREDGHVLLIAKDLRDLSKQNISSLPGNASGVAIGCVVQELDADNRLVWQWSSWHHLPNQFEETLTADDYRFKFDSSRLDHLHANAVAWTPDGHVLLSLRYLSQVIKIDRETGYVIWKMGGKANQFRFVNDPFNGFSFQHDAVLHPDGHLTLYDNGNERDPPRSRAVEYRLDEDKKIATLVWQYSPGIWGAAMGSHQRLANGNHGVSWGGIEGDPGGAQPFYSEISPDGEELLRMRFKKGMGYRAARLPFEGIDNSTKPTLLLDTNAEPATLHYSWNGATKVAKWRVLGGWGLQKTYAVEVVNKTRFEHSTALTGKFNPTGSCVYFRVEALNVRGTIIGSSDTIFPPWCPKIQNDGPSAGGPTDNADPKRRQESARVLLP